MTVLLDTRAKRKGKQRALSADENDSGSSGIVLNMDMVWTSYYAVAYTVPLQVGSSQQNLSLQVDTGSSDLWIASNSCSSSSCSGTSGRLYDPGSSQSTGTSVTIQYLAGTVSGPIVWDEVLIGGYSIPDQALAAATTVNDEPLSYNFDGILGLALPSNSLIQEIIPASAGDAPDGAAISSNLFSLGLATNAPQPFFSLTLARPGSSQLPSLLGIGSHPPEVVSDPSQISYSPLVSESIGTLFWKTTVRAITVYVDGQALPVALQSLSGVSSPTALLDSGIPLIITTPALANGIYGALGIGPASDGNYYVPCATPLNMTITLDGQSELALHPLDLTTEPAGESDSQYCTGLIQTDPSQLTATSDIGDMILGVPFMRNVYTVLAYEQPDAVGNFNNSVQFGTAPTLGLLGLTNATQAMEEFNQVRVLKQPLGSGGSQQSALSEGDESPFSVGAKVLVGLVGFFVLCLALCGLRFLFARRRWRRSSSVERDEDGDMSDQKAEHGAYQSAPLYYDPSSHKTETPSYATIDEGVDEEEVESGTEIGVWMSKVSDMGLTTVPRSRRSCDRDSPGDARELTSALLMAHDRRNLQAGDLAAFETGLTMAGIGTAARGSVIDEHDRPSDDNKRSSALLQPTTESEPYLRSSLTALERSRVSASVG